MNQAYTRAHEQYDANCGQPNPPQPHCNNLMDSLVQINATLVGIDRLDDAIEELLSCALFSTSFADLKNVLCDDTYKTMVRSRPACPPPRDSCASRLRLPAGLHFGRRNPRGARPGPQRADHELHHHCHQAAPPRPGRCRPARDRRLLAPSCLAVIRTPSLPKGAGTLLPGESRGARDRNPSRKQRENGHCGAVCGCRPSPWQSAPGQAMRWKRRR